MFNLENFSEIFNLTHINNFSNALASIFQKPNLETGPFGVILNIAVCGSKNIWLVFCAEDLFSRSASLKYVEFYYPILKLAQISFKLLVFKSNRVVLLKQKYKSIFIQAITFSTDLNSCYKVKTL